MAAERQSAPFDLAGVAALNDMQFDYYGKRAAGAAADNTVHVWEVADGTQRHVAQLKGHEGPVWKIAWAHPKFGSLLATCGYDMKVIVWKEVAAHNWQIAFMDTSHVASVNEVEFCPWEYGLRLACASSDGTVSILSHSADQQWHRVAFPAHPGGAQTLSWMPAFQRDGAAPVLRLVSGGCDNSITVWRHEEGDNSWAKDPAIMPAPAHKDWVRSVACCPTAKNSVLMASGSWDKTVVIWIQEMDSHAWRQVCTLPMNGKVESLSWSVTGNMLAVAFGEGEMVLYKEAYDGRFEEVGRGDESGLEEIRPVIVQEATPNQVAHSFVAPPPVAEAASAPPSQFQEQQQSVLDSFAGF